MNVTLVPWQIVVADAAMLTETGNGGFTVIVSALLVAGLPVAHGVTFEVMITLTTSLFESVEVVNVLLVVGLPMFTPFTRH